MMTDGTVDESAGRPIGRRVILGSLIASGAGIVFGARVQDVLQQLLLPITLHDPTGLSDLLPVAGRFRIYSVMGSSAAFVTGTLHRGNALSQYTRPVANGVHSVSRERLFDAGFTLPV